MSSKLRIGVIGSGAIAQNHVLGYRKAGVKIVALCDVNEGTLAQRQKEWEIANGHTDFHELLRRDDIDAVSICTPNASHHPITVSAAKAGKHVLCEKPVSMDLDQAQEMIEAADSAGIVLQVGHHMRSWSAAAKAAEMVARGDIGKLAYARFRQAHDWGGRRTVRGVFGSKEASGGGTLLDNGCHLFDLARYLGGDVHDVYARIATLKFDVEVEDTAISSLGFASGAIGQVEVAWTGTGWHEAFWLFGTEGSLECDNRIGANVLTHRYRAGGAGDWGTTDVARYELAGEGAHTQHVVNFVAAITGTGPNVCTGHDGREAVRLVLASYESAAAGTPITITG